MKHPIERFESVLPSVPEDKFRHAGDRASAAIHSAKLIERWQKKLNNGFDWWLALASPEVTGKDSPCGTIYEFPLDERYPFESFAIADMRNIKFAEPHYHINGEAEVYFVLEGYGTIVIGDIESSLEPGSVVTILPGTSHYTIPAHERDGLILGVVNTPPFDPENYVAIDTKADAPQIGFKAQQFKELTKNL